VTTNQLVFERVVVASWGLIGGNQPASRPYRSDNPWQKLKAIMDDGTDLVFTTNGIGAPLAIDRGGSVWRMGVDPLPPSGLSLDDISLELLNHLTSSIRLLVGDSIRVHYSEAGGACGAWEEHP
jgi:hypothetical protein